MSKDHNKGDNNFINQEQMDKISKEIGQFSASLSERMIINNIEKKIHTDLMFLRRDLRNVLLKSMKDFRDMSEIPIQKLSLLERDQRDQAILLLKNTLLDNFIVLIKNERRDLIEFIDHALNDFFKAYLEF